MPADTMQQDGITLRKAGSGDAAALAELGARTFTETFGHLYRNEDLQAFLQTNHARKNYAGMLADPAWAIWVAETNMGELVGYVAAGPCGLPAPDMPENSGELARLYILKPYHGGGLGQRMLTIALDWLEAKFDHIYLSVYAENYGAQRLYQRHGFEKIHDYFYMVGEHADPEWIMKRQDSR